MRTQTTMNFENLYETLKNDLSDTIANKVSKIVEDRIGSLLAEQQHNSAVLLKEGSVLKMYGISRSFLRKLRNEEGLPCIKVGDSVRYNKKQLDEFFMKYQFNVKKVKK